MKAPPPFSAAWTGKRRKFPRPMAFPARANISPILEAHFSRLLIAGIKEHSALLFPFEEALKELADTLLDYLAGVQRDGGCADRTCDLERHHDPTLAVLEKGNRFAARSEEHTSELQSQSNLVCRLLLEIN